MWQWAQAYGIYWSYHAPTILKQLVKWPFENSSIWWQYLGELGEFSPGFSICSKSGLSRLCQGKR